jgi:XTP/dITP diphosphohydrolase
MTLCFATNNRHKLQEIQAVLGAAFTLVTPQDVGCHEELPETGRTLEANSFEKTKFLSDHYRVNAFGDDTGLEVPALGGEPGVDSAHYAGPARDAAANMKKLLQNLEGKPDRSARFRTVITLVLDGDIRQFEGIVAGTLLDAPRGTGGFGYDPLFVPDGHDRTFAEMTVEEKGTLSHRARAFEKLKSYLNEIEP